MKSPRMFPDAALCRTSHVNGQVYRCLADDACRCPHNLAFAYSFYCNHADSRQFTGKADCNMPASVVSVSDAPWHLRTHAAGN
jgi:hypothetical protein